MKVVMQQPIPNLRTLNERVSQAANSIEEIKRLSREMIQSSLLVVNDSHQVVAETLNVIAASKKSIAKTRREHRKWQIKIARAR